MYRSHDLVKILRQKFDCTRGLFEYLDPFGYRRLQIPQELGGHALDELRDLRQILLRFVRLNPACELLRCVGYRVGDLGECRGQSAHDLPLCGLHGRIDSLQPIVKCAESSDRIVLQDQARIVRLLGVSLPFR